MADQLELDFDNPYIELMTVRKNEKFIAKEASIFEEEKKVADKAPVTTISINDLSTSNDLSNSKSKIKLSKKKPAYIIDIADFFYHESAVNVKNRFKKEANLTNIKIKTISKNKFKVYSGPYDSFKSMKETYLSLYNLGFEELNVIDSNK